MYSMYIIRKILILRKMLEKLNIDGYKYLASIVAKNGNLKYFAYFIVILRNNINLKFILKYILSLRHMILVFLLDCLRFK